MLPRYHCGFNIFAEFIHNIMAGNNMAGKGFSHFQRHMFEKQICKKLKPSLHLFTWQIVKLVVLYLYCK